VVCFLLTWASYSGIASVTSVGLRVIVSPITAVRGLVRPRAVPGAYFQSFQYDHNPEVSPPPAVRLLSSRTCHVTYSTYTVVEKAALSDRSFSLIILSFAPSRRVTALLLKSLAAMFLLYCHIV